MQRRSQEGQCLPPAPLAAQLQAPPGDGVDGRGACLPMLIPRLVDAPPCAFPTWLVRPLHEVAGGGEAQRLGLSFHRAADGAGQLVVEAPPSVDAILAQRADQVLLRQIQALMPTFARMFHGETGRRRGVVGQIRLDHRVRCPIQERREGFGQRRQPLVVALQPAQERSRRGDLAVHAQQAMRVRAQVAEQHLGFLGKGEHGPRHGDDLAGPRRRQRFGLRQMRRQPTALLVQAIQRGAKTGKVFRHVGRIRRGVFRGEVPLRALNRGSTPRSSH